MQTILVVGSNFAGSTAALEVKRKLEKENIEHQVIVISPRDLFLYVPSLIWLPFGLRKLEDISFKISPVLRKKNIAYIDDEVLEIDPDHKQVKTAHGQVLNYNYLVIATGAAINDKIIPGFEHVDCIVTPQLAKKTLESFNKLIEDPGPVVVGATPYASCMGAAYEYLFNLEKELRRHGVRKKVKITWITPEPELGHFGIGGISGGEWMLTKFMNMYDIDFRVNAEITHIEKNKIYLKSGEVLDFKMAMLIPPFIGAKPVRNNLKLADEKGFIECNDSYQSIRYPEVFAAGLSVQVKAPFGKCAVPFGVPKTGFPSDIQGKIVSHNIVQSILNKPENFKKLEFGKIPGICIMDAGHKEVFILTDHLFRPRRFEVMIPNVFYNIGKRFLEFYMIYKNRHGLSWLP